MRLYKNNHEKKQKTRFQCDFQIKLSVISELFDVKERRFLRLLLHLNRTK